jgi:integrase
MAKVSKRKWQNKEGKISYAWFIDCNDKSGKRVRQSGFKTKADAERALAKVVNNINTGVYIQEDKYITFGDASKLYMDLHVSIYCKKSTKEGYEGYLKNHLIPCFGTQKLVDIKTQQIQAFVKDKVEEELSNQTINHILILMSCVFNKMIDDEVILKNPVNKVKKLKLTKKEMKILTMEEVYKVLEVAKEHYPSFYPALFTAIFTGMRQGELIALKWDKINWIKEQIYISENYRQGTLSTPKTENSVRYIDMPQELVKVLKEWRLRCPHSKDNLVFPNREGNYQDINNLVKRKFQKVLNKAKIDVIRWHDLRHTYASIMITLSQTVPIKYIQHQLGHASIQITMDRYGHLMPEVNQNAKNAIDNLFIAKAEKELKTAMQ